MAVTPPKCKLCLKPHWIRDGCPQPDPEKVATPKLCSGCGTAHGKWEKCPPAPVQSYTYIAHRDEDAKLVVFPTDVPKRIEKSTPGHRPARNELSRAEESSAQPSERNVEAAPERPQLAALVEQQLEAGKTCKTRFDKKTYMREYMRKYRRGERQRPAR